MGMPVIGTITVSANRHVSFTIYFVDSYAATVLVERRTGTSGDFAFVGSVQASQQSFSEVVPNLSQNQVWYRVRQKAPGGALSPYSFPSGVVLP
jgi:hypothetical protein